MNGRAPRLQRLLVIRRLSEEMTRRDLALSVAAVNEVKSALAQQQNALVEARLETRLALATGERGGWLLAEAQSEVAGWNRRRLSELLSTRTDAIAPAMERFVECRQEHEQMKLLVKNAHWKELIELDRSAQAATDDWFLSRRGKEVG